MGVRTTFSYGEYNLEKQESLKRLDSRFESIFDFGMNSRTMSIRTMSTRNTTNNNSALDSVLDPRVAALPYYPAHAMTND